MSRIADAFQRAPLLIAYLTAGDPSEEGFQEAALGAVEGGAGILEVGVPFSDPVADGPAIQASHGRACARGGGAESTLEAARDIRRRCDAPIVLFSYLNPLLAVGPERFLEKCRGAGVDGLLTLDLPAGEEPAWFNAVSEAGLEPILLVSPTTSPRRMERILPEAKGFVYLLSRAGITGTHAGPGEGLAERVAEVRAFTSLPVAVGFGVRGRQDSAAVAACADGVVVGSALVERVALAPAGGHRERARSFVKELAAPLLEARAKKERSP